MKLHKTILLVAAAIAGNASADDAGISMTCNGVSLAVEHKVDDITKKGRAESSQIQFNINQPASAGTVRIDANIKGKCRMEIDANHIFIANSYTFDYVDSDSEIIKTDPRYNHQWPADKLAAVTASQQAVERAEWTITPLFPQKATVVVRFIASYRTAN